MPDAGGPLDVIAMGSFGVATDFVQANDIGMLDLDGR